jgi:hypothetical protein
MGDPPAYSAMFQSQRPGTRPTSGGNTDWGKNMKLKSALAVSAATIATIGLTVAPSTAAQEKETVPLDCGSDGTYMVTVNGNGDFTPGRDTASTTVVVPIAFENERFVATAPDGTVLADDTNPDREVKGQVESHNPRQQVHCTFALTFVLDQPEEGFPAGTTLSITGDVIGYLTPAR